MKNRYQRVTITCARQILEVYFHSILQILKRNFHTQSEVVNLWSYSYYSISPSEQTYSFLCTDSFFLLGSPENYSMTTLLIHNENYVVCHKTLVNLFNYCTSSTKFCISNTDCHKTLFLGIYTFYSFTSSFSSFYFNFSLYVLCLIPSKINHFLYFSHI